ncbi:MAG: iron complex transport system substrate-binding protein [Planctomycetota bacterium]|jgi:iron complex transport system substrate-binding protein
MRIVSLCPSLTELVFDLDAGHELVGITDYCIHPKLGVEHVEKVGGTKDPRVDRIVELAPDLVLLNQEENREQDAVALEGAGLHCLTTFPKTIPDTADMVRVIADAIGRQEAGEVIAVDIEQRGERVRRESEALPPVRFAYLIWRKPWMTVNADTFTNALLQAAGGENVFGGHEMRFPAVKVEELAATAPQVVLLSSEPFPFAEKHIKELAARTGLPEGSFRLVDGELLSWHGSRTPRGIDYAEQLLTNIR